MAKKSDAPTVVDIQHPDYMTYALMWEKWRYTYQGGQAFIQRYLQKYSAREDDGDFQLRKGMTYCPAFAKAAVDEIKNAIFQRVADVTREGGSDSYQRACNGQLDGVDLLGSTMNSFMGRKVLPELLVQKKVGIFVDMAKIPDKATLAERGNAHPYCYIYWAEDIRSWSYDPRSNAKEFSSVLLRDWDHLLDPTTGLPIDWLDSFRHVYISPEDGYVWVQKYDRFGNYVNFDGFPDSVPAPVRLNIRKIPFMVCELEHSLMQDVAEYQIALLNMSSADVDFCIKANFAFYIEQADARINSPHLRSANQGVSQVQPDGTTQQSTGKGEGQLAKQALTAEIRTGVARGRRYPKDTNAPSFINPSPEPLRVSMEKQDKMIAQMRQLVHLSTSALDPGKASAESKNFDERSLECGLSAIGMELEQAERRLQKMWRLYEPGPEATIRYPSSYSLQTDADRRDEAKELASQLAIVPSKTYQKEVCKQIAKKLIGSKVSNEKFEEILKEVDTSKWMTSDWNAIVQDVQNGLVSNATASLARGYEPGETDKAATEHAARLARIAAAQATPGSDNNGDAGARGIKDLSSDANAGKNEKTASKDTTKDSSVTSKVRGDGK